MQEFSAQDAIRSPWDASLKGRAIKLFLGLAGLFVGLGVMGWLNLAWFRLTDVPLLMLLAVGGPIATAGLMLTLALVIVFSRPLAWMVQRFALVIFLGGVVGVVLPP